MHTDDLNKIWICDECKMRFIFFSDVEDHTINTGHSILSTYDLLSGEMLAS